MRRLSSIASGPICPASHGFFSRPTPCSLGNGAAERHGQVHDLSEGEFGAAGHRGVIRSKTISGWVFRRPRARSPKWSADGPRRSGRFRRPIRPAPGGHAHILEQQRTFGLNRRDGEPAGDHECFAPSSGSDVEKTSVAPCSANTRAMNSASSAPDGPRSSDAATIIAAAERSRPIRSLSSTALMATESMNSSIDGRIRPVIVTTASAAACTESNVATTVHAAFCWGVVAVSPR